MKRLVMLAVAAAIAGTTAAHAAPPPPPFSCTIHYVYVADGVGVPTIVCYG